MPQHVVFQKERSIHHISIYQTNNFKNRLINIAAGHCFEVTLAGFE